MYRQTIFYFRMLRVVIRKQYRQCSTIQAAVGTSFYNFEPLDLISNTILQSYAVFESYGFSPMPSIALTIILGRCAIIPFQRPFKKSAYYYRLEEAKIQNSKLKAQYAAIMNTKDVMEHAQE